MKAAAAAYHLNVTPTGLAAEAGSDRGSEGDGSHPAGGIGGASGSRSGNPCPGHGGHRHGRGCPLKVHRSLPRSYSTVRRSKLSLLPGGVESSQAAVSNERESAPIVLRRKQGVESRKFRRLLGSAGQG